MKKKQSLKIQKAKFTSTLFKGWQGSRGQRPIVALRRERNSLNYRLNVSCKSVISNS